MNQKTALQVFILLWLITAACQSYERAAKAAGSQSEKADANSVEQILMRLKQKTAELKSFQAQIDYRYLQPWLESQTQRKGVLYYARFDEKSSLRIDFKSLKQDDEKERKYREEFIFDGVWLTHIEYQIKQVRLYQLTEPNKPMDAFELASRNFPVVGFAKIEDLKHQFDITLVKQGEEDNSGIPVKPVSDPNLKAGAGKFFHLHLKVKPDSKYKDKYVSIDFWIDKKLGLPVKLVAVTAEEEDVFQIRLLKPKVNEPLKKSVFKVKVPEGFGEPEIIPFKKKAR
jgi:hypothetical protein